jgi:hypothetical protein
MEVIKIILFICFLSLSSCASCQINCYELKNEKQAAWEASRLEKEYFPELQDRSEYWQGAGDAYLTIEQQYCH